MNRVSKSTVMRITMRKIKLLNSPHAVLLAPLLCTVALSGCALTPSAPDAIQPAVVQDQTSSGLVPVVENSRPAQLGNVVGIDMARYQGKLDFGTIRRSGNRFVFVKATRGKISDPAYADNIHRARCAGLVVGSYHYFLPEMSAKLQFEKFAEVADAAPGDLPPVVDIEVLDNSSDAKLASELKDFIGQLENRYQVKPIIYSSASFANRNLKGFSEYPLWVAEYGPRLKMPLDWKTWTFWQYQEGVKVTPEVSSPDLNRFNGDLDQFQKLLIGPAVPLEASKLAANCPAT